ncbi:hypothetical protein HZS_4184 [Henneguya salminicola]|nr:hypothetical protein HZS_4184 [Henneguya salminicola]
MDKLVEVINKLQDTFSLMKIECPFDLPQIAVVGEQSAGKSSVLENFVGKDFLPRGSGIVTRRPLVLQLINQMGPEYGEFLHSPKLKYTRFEEIRSEIERETNRVTGLNKNISPLPINLRIYSPHVVNLTLVDLPGITKVPVGEQPKDIEMQIKKMILQFISKPNCLILAVIPAIIDVANSEALKLANEVDPNKCRTIGVVTKIDMMDQGTDCLNVLDNTIYPLRRGFIGIVNRNQKDIEGHKNINAAQEKEMVFFNSHPKYQSISDRLGTKYLQKCLCDQLSQHIREVIPQLKNNILKHLHTLEALMDKKYNLSNNLSEDPSQASNILMIKIQELSYEIDSSLGYRNDEINLLETNSGVKISQIFTNRFLYEIQKIEPLQEDCKKCIKTAITNARGVSNRIFSPGAAFLAVITHLMDYTKTPCFIIIDLVTQEINTMFRSIKNKKQEEQYGCWDGIYHSQTRNISKSQRTIELVCKNSPDLDNWMAAFISAGLQLDRSDEKQSFISTTFDDSEIEMNTQIEYVNVLIVSYMNLTTKILQDIMMKMCVSCLIIPIRKSIISELIIHLFSTQNIISLMTESPDIIEKRKELSTMRSSCKEALKLLNEFISFNDLNVSKTIKHLPSLYEDTDQISSISLDSTDIPLFSLKNNQSMSETNLPGYPHYDISDDNKKKSASLKDVFINLKLEF